MKFSIHLKALLYKEFCLLRSDKKRVFAELCLSLIMGLILIYSGKLLISEQAEGDLLNQQYISCDDQSECVFKRGFYFNLDDPCNQLNKYIGLVSDNTQFIRSFKSKLYNLNQHYRVLEFETIEKLKEHAKNPHKAKAVTKEICIGVSFFTPNENPDEYKYTLHVNKQSNLLTQQKVYNELSSYFGV